MVAAEAALCRPLGMSALRRAEEAAVTFHPLGRSALRTAEAAVVPLHRVERKSWQILFPKVPWSHQPTARPETETTQCSF